MKPYYSDDAVTILNGDALACLREMPDESVHCVVTSPPYWGLRDYGTAEWEGGDPECDHLAPLTGGIAKSGLNAKRDEAGHLASDRKSQPDRTQYRSECKKCGATRTDSQMGLEPTPEEYVAKMVDVFREARRVLRSDGTLWLNLGDSYASSPASGGSVSSGLNAKRDGDGALAADNKSQGITPNAQYRRPPGLKPKDLVGIPWRVAFALQADGWYLRSDIIWSKPNPMPESVTDRPTKAHEYVFLLTKSARYFYDAPAIAEVSTTGDARKPYAPGQVDARGNGHARGGGATTQRPCESRNKRTVWTITTKPYSEAHFATFPPELPTLCIKAGTSERGCCPECGDPWERIVEAESPDGRRAEVKGGKAYDQEGRPLMGDNMIDHGVRGAWNSSGQTLKRSTVGWRPTCECEQHEDDDGVLIERPDEITDRWVYRPEPCTVLDLFAGAGTTSWMAKELCRRAVAIELNPEYCAMIAERCRQGVLAL